MKITLDVRPISTNAIWRTTGKGVTYKTPKYVEFTQTVQEQLLEKRVRMYKEKVHLRIEFHFKTRRCPDLDNCLKSLIDSMQGIVYKNDSQIHKITCTKHECSGFDKIVVRAREIYL